MRSVGANSHKSRPGWREAGLLEEFRLDDAVNNPQRCFELWDVLLYHKVMSEPNITLLLESVLYGAETKGGRIERVMVRCDKSECLYRIKAKMYLDCTGDSRLGLEAGAQMRTGREARSEFNESLAPEKADNQTLGSSILFTSRLHQKAMPFTAPPWARTITKDQLRHRGIDSWEYGYWWVEWGGNLDTIRDNERIRFELLSIVLGVWDYIKNSGEFPGSANWALDWIGMMPGKRGSRRLVGDHILTQNDLLSGDFDDAVAIGGWPMDDHPPGGFDRADLPPNTVLRTPSHYVGIAIAVGFGGLYSVGFLAFMETLIGDSENLGVISPVVVLLFIEAVLFGAIFGLTKLIPWLTDARIPKVTVFAATAFTAAFYIIVGGGVEMGVLTGMGTMVFAAPAVGAFLLGQRE